PTNAEEGLQESYRADHAGAEVSFGVRGGHPVQSAAWGGNAAAQATATRPRLGRRAGGRRSARERSQGGARLDHGGGAAPPSSTVDRAHRHSVAPQGQIG